MPRAVFTFHNELMLGHSSGVDGNHSQLLVLCKVKSLHISTVMQLESRHEAYLDRHQDNEGDNDGQYERLFPVAHTEMDYFCDDAAVVLWLQIKTRLAAHTAFHFVFSQILRWW